VKKKAIPNITARFHSYDDIGWYGSAYMLTASAFQPLYGRIYMSFQTKTSYLAALVVFEIGSVVAATSPSSKALIVGRAVQGLGSAGLLTGAFVVGTHSVRLQHRPVLFAGVGILYGVGSLCGPLIGGAFTDTIGWRWCCKLQFLSRLVHLHHFAFCGTKSFLAFLYLPQRTFSCCSARQSYKPSSHLFLLTSNFPLLI
jgi:MFS family permease